ncbi:22410_t:CDS:1, partial [Dentiscutata erythropus]
MDSQGSSASFQKSTYIAESDSEDNNNDTSSSTNVPTNKEKKVEKASYGNTL